MANKGPALAFSGLIARYGTLKVASYDGTLGRETVRKGDSNDDVELMVKTVKTAFQRDLNDFELKMKVLEELVEPLRGRWLEDLLGVDGY